MCQKIYRRHLCGHESSPRYVSCCRTATPSPSPSLTPTPSSSLLPTPASSPGPEKERAHAHAHAHASGGHHTTYYAQQQYLQPTPIPALTRSISASSAASSTTTLASRSRRAMATITPQEAWSCARGVLEFSPEATRERCRRPGCVFEWYARAWDCCRCGRRHNTAGMCAGRRFGEYLAGGAHDDARFCTHRVCAECEPALEFSQRC